MPVKNYTISFTKKELDALSIVVSEGIEAIVTDHQATKGYLGGKRGADAAVRASDKISSAISAAKDGAG